MYLLAKKLGKYGTKPGLTYSFPPTLPKNKVTQGHGAYLEALSYSEGLDN